ncbi:putative acid phosphatase [Microsporum canis]
MSGIKSPLALLVLLGAQQVMSVDVSWHAPNATKINNLDKVLSSDGVYGFIFDSSQTPDKEYGKYNWCNMPHVRPKEYPKAPKGYKLQYVEIIHRHHKRTPYESNTFPQEAYPWHCDDEGLFYYGEPKHGRESTKSYWKGYQNPINPFQPSGFKGSCSFPQISKEGLDDSWQHGRDLYAVYHKLLHFLPLGLDHDKISFRVTNNMITSQVAGMLINGMYGIRGNTPLNVEVCNGNPINIVIIPNRPLFKSPQTDSLEPKYSCPKSSSLFSEVKDAPNTPWADHLTRTKEFVAELDAISGVSPSNSGWHSSFDHYFDNLSARLCHAKPLPCNIKDPSKCITRAQADKVFRLGQFEYSYMYRDATSSLPASTSSLGVWIAELAQHLRDQIAGKDGKMLYRHNVAHDGSVSRLLSVLQLDVMVWPGMGSEVVFELYSKNKDVWGREKDYFVRVLFSGQVMRSSNPDLGLLDMVPVSTLLAYFDGLVGEKANLVPGLCGN